MSIDIYIMIFFMIIILLCILCKNPIIKNSRIDNVFMYFSNSRTNADCHRFIIFNNKIMIKKISFLLLFDFALRLLLIRVTRI